MVEEQKRAQPEVIIGIDAGTTNFAVARWEYSHDAVTVIQNQEGQRTTPSMISIRTRDDTVQVGTPAKTVAIRQPETTFYDAKRMIGKSYEDESIQE